MDGDLQTVREIGVHGGEIPTSWKVLGPYAPQGSTSLLPKLSVTSKVSAPTSGSLSK